MEILKTTGPYAYSTVCSIAAVTINDSYTTVFIDPFFWAAAFIGMGLMLFIENKDPKAPPVTWNRILFSIFACLAIIFMSGTVRAGMLEAKDFQRSYYFYSIVLFLCAIAPEMVRIIVGGSGKAIGDGFNEGIKKRVTTWVGGNSTDSNEQPTNTPENE